MAPRQPRDKSPSCDIRSRDFDSAEKGLYDCKLIQIAPLKQAYFASKEAGVVEHHLPPAVACPIHEDITPSSAGPIISTPRKAIQSPEPSKKASKAIHFRLWFHVYRQFFLFVILLNVTAMILASVDKFPYAQNHLGAFVLGNLLFAVLVRNELLLRGLYMLAIYGLRKVRADPCVWKMCLLTECFNLPSGPL
jgi:hypothetical protein